MLFLLLWQALMYSQPNKPQPITTVAQLLAAANDPKAIINWHHPGPLLNSLTPEQLKTVYKQLIVAPHEGLAESQPALPLPG